MDDTFTIAPRLTALIFRAASWATMKAPVRLVPITLSHDESSKDRNGARAPTPALLTRAVIGPNCLHASSIAARTASRERTSHEKYADRRPSPTTSDAKVSPAQSWISMI